MVTVVQGKVCAENHTDRLSRLATIHQRYRQTDGQTDGRISYGIGLTYRSAKKTKTEVKEGTEYKLNTYTEITQIYTD